MSIADILAAKKAKENIPTTPANLEATIATIETKIIEPARVEPIDLSIEERKANLRTFIADKNNPLLRRIKARQDLAKLEQDALASSELTSIEVPVRLEEVKKEIEQAKPPVVEPPIVETPKPIETFDLRVVLNERQNDAANLAKAKKSFVLTGAAGTGKTTTAREIAKALLSQGELGTHNFKVRTPAGQKFYADGPSIAFVAYTRRATNNIRRALHKDPDLEERLRYNVLTIHALLEFEPIAFETDGGNQSMRFVPTRTKHNPLRITHIVIEEASMLGTNLGKLLLDALPEGVQIIYMGDINQLQPVMDKPMFSYALVKLPVIELTEVYRQAFDSDIIKGAHLILKGEAKEFLDLLKTSTKKQIKLVTGGAKNHSEETLVQALSKSFNDMFEAGTYDPNQDMILSPFNKNALGTININNWIAQHLGVKRDAIVYEVIAGRRKLYLAVGDKVMYDKRDGIITKITINGSYIGTAYQPHSKHLSRFGIPIIGGQDQDYDNAKEEDLFIGYENLNVDDDPNEEKKREASHIIDIQYDDGGEDTINAVGDFSETMFSLGYALTVHKAQGCEWRKVFLIMHQNHATMLSRELFYTAITRAKDQIQIIAKEGTVTKAITNARIKGQSLREKIEYFNSGALDASLVEVTK